MQVWEQFGLIECDLADLGVDLEDDVLLAARSWRWLWARIVGLFTAPKPTRLGMHFAPPDQKPKPKGGDF